MNSQESREESSIDHNDESDRTCDSCGESYSHEATAGPGRSTRSCGCDVVLNPVADDTPVGVANVAIRALNAEGDVETAADVHEGARGRLVSDGGSSCGKRSCDDEYEVAVGTSARCGLHALEDAVDGIGPSKAEQLMEEFGSLEAICYAAEWNSVAIARLDGWSATTAGDLEEKLKDAGVWVEDSEAETGADAGEVKGTLILATDRGQSPTWHHSVGFDGDVHTTACGSSIQCSEIDEAELDVSSSVLEDADRVCPTCEESVADHEEQLIADGGVPETFDDLAGTCESCGDDVDPGRLIEGECPGCHYRPATDGGVELEDIGTVVSSTQFEGDRFALETADACVVFEFMSPELARATAETMLPDGYEVVEKTEPMADGGFHTVTRDGQEFAVVRQQEFAEDATLDIDPSGRISNYDEVEKEIVVRLLSVDAIAAQELENRVISPGDHDWEEEYAGLELGQRVVVEDELTADGGTTWTDLTGFKRDLLEAIRRLDNEGETTYGLAIKEELERVYGQEVNHGRLYPNLDDLVDAGLVEKRELDKRTNEYELTDAAEAMLEQRARHLADACGMEQPVADGGEQA